VTAEQSAALRGSAVVVIGGSSGIGHEIARQAQALGAVLTITGRDASKLATSAQKLGGIQTALLDAHDETALEHFFTGLHPAAHIVSMVGDSMTGGYLTTTPQTMRHVLHSKFWTNWMIGRYAATTLQPGGSLTFTAGTGARAHDASATHVANLGLGALVAGLAFEMAPGQRVNAVAPTFMGTHTAFWTDIPTSELEQQQAGFSELVPLKRVATVEEVASTYIHLMTNTFITGQVLAVDGGVMLDK
jgi:NAD(P)-dependent dehydrogenase (short-subunit alcohol dehydrogenase family)